MDKEQEQKQEISNDKGSSIKNNDEKESADNNSELKPQTETNEKKEEITNEEKIIELEDKLARTFAEMENQRRRFEKEKEDAYEYGGYAFA